MNKEEIDKLKPIIKKMTQDAKDRGLVKPHTEAFKEEPGISYCQIVEGTEMFYKDFVDLLLSSLDEANSKIEKIREMFTDEKLTNLNKYYCGDSYECDVHELRNDILSIIEGDKK